MAPTKPRPPKNTVQEDQVRRALEERRSEGTSFRKLAVKYGVSSSTLSDRARGGLSRQEGHSHRQKLTPAMEKALEEWCKQLDDWGFPPRLDLLRAMALALAKLRAEEEDDLELAQLGKHWLSKFLDRHPALSAKFGTQLDRQRAYASNLASLRDYFRKLQKLIRKHNLKPEDIFKLDEKGFIIGMSAKAKVICRVGRRPPRVTQDGTREMLTVIECCCAALYMLPSFVIFKGVAQYMGWHSETSDPDALFACSPNGWTDDELALEWLYHFDRCTKERKGGNGRTRLLILDGHRPHITLEFCQYAVDNNIELLCFPPHSTHLLQPLDVGLFSPLQKYYGKAADDHIRQTRTGVLKGTFWRFYAAACRQAYTKQNIKSAWRKTGIHPFNPDAVLTQVTVPRSVSSAKKVLKTPQKSRDIRQQFLSAIDQIKSGNEESTIATLRRFAHTAETALHIAEIKSIELADVRREYAGKKAATTGRRVITKARVIDGASVKKIKEEREEQDRVKAQRAEARIKTARTKGKGSVAVEAGISGPQPKLRTKKTKVIIFATARSLSKHY